MKKLALVSAIVVGGLFSKTADAQIAVNLGFHFGGHRVFAPVARVAVDAPVYQENIAVGYSNDDDYYYLPDVDAYYNVAEQSYYYNDGENWVSAAYLPGYQNYDWRHARRFEVRAHRPYLNNGFYSSRYGGHENQYPNDNRVYSDRNIDRGAYRGEDQRFENRGGYGQQNQRFDNHGDGNNEQRGQVQQFNRERNYTQPAKPNREQGNYGRSEQQNHGQNNYQQPAQQNRRQNNYNQPSNSSQERGGNNGGQQVQPNHQQNGHEQSAHGNMSNGGGQMHFSNNQMHVGSEQFRRS